MRTENILIAFFFLLPQAPLHAANGLIPLGAASYATNLPEGAKRPPPARYHTSSLSGKMPSNDWWSSLAWTSNSFAHFPHPLAVKTEPAGLRVAYPANITANSSGIFGGMPGGSNDFIIGHSAQEGFPKPLVDGFSDWFVTVLFSEGANRLRVSYGHGSPFVYAIYEGGEPRVLFPQPPQIWAGAEHSATLGITIAGKHYALFGPSGSSWKGLNTKTLGCETGGKTYFSVAALPDNSKATLSLFQRHAYAHVTDTRINWNYDSSRSIVETRFTFATTPREGTETNTLFALYPHQWRNTDTPLLPASYNSVRGPMKLAQGSSFTTRMVFPGVLPSLPNAGGCSPEKMSAAIQNELDHPRTNIADTYWNGKQLGKLATLIPLAEQYSLNTAADTLRDRLRGQLEYWFSAAAPNDDLKRKGLFYYDEQAGTLIGYPASYGSDTELNDHHFHYGYFIKAAAELARHDSWAGDNPRSAASPGPQQPPHRRDPTWASDTRWGGLVNLLIRDIASPDHHDPQFPFLRCLDPYAGHSWASGFAKFGDGNNNESSSEAMNAWCGIILWGEAISDRALRDLGIYLFTTELHAIQEYWFNVHGDTFPATYPASVVTMVWGGKGANATWFSGNPASIHGINWLPIHGGSLYLGLYPDYVGKNYNALLSESEAFARKSARPRSGTALLSGTAVPAVAPGVSPQVPTFTAWPDIIWMYRALSNPADAIEQFEAASSKTRFEDGNSHANTLHWLYNLKVLGRVQRTVTADTPLYAVFQNGLTRIYAVYNMKNETRTVTFSDGHKLSVTKPGFTLDKRTTE